MPQLTWLGDAQAKLTARRVPYRLLETVSLHGTSTASPASGESEARGAEPAGGEGEIHDNWLIQGDNLEALKALLPFYAGRVKCIFIDPPYNTKSAFEHYDDNLEHSQWLSMMLPRLELLRDLLAEDGSIWVTIDDNEGHYLKVVMDEVFGRRNFVTNVVWRKNYSPKSSARQFSEDHDHLLVYARNGATWVPNPMPRSDKQDKAYKNPDSDPRGPWKTSDLSARNPYSLGIYEVTCPSGRIIEGPPKGRYWSISKDRLLELDADNRIWWGKDKNAIPQLKRFLTDVKQGVVPQTLWPYEEVGHTQEAKKEVVILFGDDVFGTPKPERLLKRVIEVATNPGDLVLDSFLGSGTTAAVAHKMGRRWIGIEMGAHAETHCLPRLQKVIEGEQGGISQTVGWAGGGGFRFMRLGEAAFLDDGRINPAVHFATLAGYLWFLETGAPLPSPPVPLPQAGEGSKSPSPSGRGVGVRDSTPILGVHGDTALVLLYNGILGDRRPAGGNVLTSVVWEQIRALLPEHAGRWLIYGEASRMPESRRRALDIEFKQIPYDIRMK